MEIKSEIRFCEDIGMFATDRSIKKSCNHRTKFCANCYNHKIEKRFRKAMAQKDERNEVYWSFLDGDRLKKDLQTKRKSTKRFRFQTRGETFAEISDVFKVLDIIQKNPETDFWIPTRGWRDKEIRYMLEQWIMPFENAFLQASTDPTNTEEEWKSLKDSGWNFMHYGNDDWIRDPLGNLTYPCPKTFFHDNGSCMTCKDGCFNKNTRTVLLKQH